MYISWLIAQNHHLYSSLWKPVHKRKPVRTQYTLDVIFFFRQTRSVLNFDQFKSCKRRLYATIMKLGFRVSRKKPVSLLSEDILNQETTKKPPSLTWLLPFINYHLVFFSSSLHIFLYLLFNRVFVKIKWKLRLPNFRQVPRLQVYSFLVLTSLFEYLHLFNAFNVSRQLETLFFLILVVFVFLYLGFSCITHL